MAYRCTVEGQYYSLSNGSKTLKRYQIECNVPELTDEEGGGIALSVIKNKLLVPLLTRKYSDYMGFRTHEITHVINLDDPTDAINEIDYMSRTELTNFINKLKLSVIPELYSTITDLRQAVKTYKENPQAFKAHQAENKEYQDKEVKLARDLASLNPELSEEPAHPTPNQSRNPRLEDMVA